MFYQQQVGEVLQKLGTNPKGLTPAEAAKRLAQYGPNAIRVRGEPLWRKLIEPFYSIFNLILIVAAVISWVEGEELDAAIISATLLISAVIYYVQRFSADRVLKALRNTDIRRVEVMRGGLVTDISQEDLVPGDIILLNEGQRVPADARLVSVENLRCDESILTGESLPVGKNTEPVQGKKEAYDQTNMLFQGTFVVAGAATAVVVATGNETEFGRLASLSGRAAPTSPMQQKIDKIITQIIFITGIIAVAGFLLSLYRGIELTEALRFMISFSVSVIPEGLPVAISIILVLAMRRMAKLKALVRNMAAIENIGIVTAIATDKTGTLTKNQLSVQEVWTHDDRQAGDVARTIRLAVNVSEGKLHDPLDGAMQEYAVKQRADVPKAYKLEASMPFDHRWSMSGNVWHDGKSRHLIVKGAPEAVLAKSVNSAADKKTAMTQLHGYAVRGYRVIALAYMKLGGKMDTLEKIPKPGLTFIGFVAVADQLRPEANQAIADAHSAGIKVQMITGDHAETAYSIGKDLGLIDNPSEVLDGRQMADMTDKQLEKAVLDAKVFSRVTPESKYRILTALRKNEIVAMTGDGVNDVPALTNAHIGVSMGSGSEIAKEAGDIILLDDNFRSIINAVREGRIVFSNIRRMLFYLLATNGGEVLTMIGALVIGMPLPVVAVQILWVNLVTDTTMVIPLGLEAAENDVMATKPRRAKAPLLDHFLLWRMGLVATAMAVVTLVTFYIFLQFSPLEYAQAIAFNVLVVMQWANALNSRSERHSLFSRAHAAMNNKLILGLVISVALQGLVLFGPLAPLMHVPALDMWHVAVTSLVSIIVIIVICELHKLLLNLGRAKV